MCLQDQRCERVVIDAWYKGQMGGLAFPINACLDLSRDRLKAWNTSKYGHVVRKFHTYGRGWSGWGCNPLPQAPIET